MRFAPALVVLLASSTVACGEASTSQERPEPAAQVEPIVESEASTVPTDADGAEAPATVSRALSTNGAVLCWIDRDGVRCREGTNASRSLPAPGPRTYAGVQVGAFELCTWGESGPAFCWPISDEERVQDGAGRARGRDVVDIALEFRGCALERDGRLACWENESAPEAETEPSPGARLELLARSCVADGSRVWCRGANEFGQVGPGCRSALCEWTPVHLPQVGRHLVTDAGESCIIDPNLRDLICWGGAPDGFQFRREASPRGVYGQPQTIFQFPAAVRATHSEGFTSCAILEDDSAWCWRGVADDGPSMGDPGQRLGLSRTPRVVATGVTDIAIGNAILCTSARSGEVRCWGPGHGVDHPLPTSPRPPGALVATIPVR